ncbi:MULTISPECIES: hypothetical protein [unclassified Caulobacter]|uniref:hypothetical protein n=1 Tax=unclassified Caulobacter TaxID=2648921 RepID=UPI001304FCF9|nr:MULTISPECIES: hypothetical protein [unclassified Caulobacter]
MSRSIAATAPRASVSTRSPAQKPPRPQAARPASAWTLMLASAAFWFEGHPVG